MLINPERYEKIKNYLNSLYEELDFLMPRLSLKFDLLAEFKWSVVLNYLLLKVLGGNPISQFLEEKMGDSLLNYKIIAVNKLNNENNRLVRSLPPSFSDFYFSFFEQYKVNPYVMRQNLQFFRTDLELKILFYLFGGKPIIYENKLVDITGALYFTKNDFKRTTETSEKKMELLETHLNYEPNGAFYPIAANFENHWVAINKIEGNKISFNDPATGKQRWGKISKRIPESYRFYFFEYDPKKIEIVKPKYITYIKSELNKELENLTGFTESLVSEVEQDFDLEQELKEEGLKEKFDKEKKEESTQEKGRLEIPKSGDQLMKDLKKKVRESFSDYSKL